MERKEGATSKSSPRQGAFRPSAFPRGGQVVKLHGPVEERRQAGGSSRDEKVECHALSLSLASESIELLR